MKKKPSPRSAGYVFGGLGLILCACGAYLFLTRAVLVATWKPATATVVESRIEHSTGRKYDAVIRVRFQAEGQPIETAVQHDYRATNYAWVAETVARHAAGTEVPIRYLPDDPRSARLAAGWNIATFWTSLTALAIGALFAGLGWLAFRSADLEEQARTAPEDQAAAAERTQTLTVGGFVLILGLAFLGAGVALAPGALRSMQWPLVTARVDNAEVVRLSSHRYAARLYVSFEHNGQAYRSTIDIPTGRQPVDAERAVLAARGGATRIRLDPEHPHRVRRPDSRPWVLPLIFLSVGTLVAAASVWVIRLGRRRG